MCEFQGICLFQFILISLFSVGQYKSIIQKIIIQYQIKGVGWSKYFSTIVCKWSSLINRAIIQARKEGNQERGGWGINESNRK